MTTLKAKILVVEDNSNVGDIIQTALKSFDYDVMLVRRGREAVEAASSYSPQLILTDLSLPGLDGIEAARRIRRNPKTQSVPMVAITATFGPEIRKKCLESGFDDCIFKPFSLRDLKATVAKSLKKQSVNSR